MKLLMEDVDFTDLYQKLVDTANGGKKSPRDCSLFPCVSFLIPCVTAQRH